MPFSYCHVAILNVLFNHFLSALSRSWYFENVMRLGWGSLDRSEVEQDSLSAIREYFTVWGAISFWKRHQSTGNSYQLARISYQYIHLFCEEHCRDLRLKLSLVRGKLSCLQILQRNHPKGKRLLLFQRMIIYSKKEKRMRAVWKWPSFRRWDLP